MTTEGRGQYCLSWQTYRLERGLIVERVLLAGLDPPRPRLRNRATADLVAELNRVVHAIAYAVIVVVVVFLLRC